MLAVEALGELMVSVPEPPVLLIVTAVPDARSEIIAAVLAKVSVFAVNVKLLPPLIVCVLAADKVKVPPVSTTEPEAPALNVLAPFIFKRNPKPAVAEI